MVQSIERLQRVWPYSVEILVFPFEHPSLDYTTLSCDDFEIEFQRPGRKIHMMEMVHLNRDENDANSLFKFIKGAMDVNEFNLSTTQYFVFTPDWDALEYHYGKSLLDMKDIILQLLKKLRPSDEL
jgi:hypothetical protein